MSFMSYPATLTVDLRRRVYGLALRIYETFEALPERGILVQDIESSTNKIVKLAASYPVMDIKDKVIRDIISELRGLRALVGIVRDTSLLERKPAVDLVQDALLLEDLFREVVDEYQNDTPIEIRPPSQPRDVHSSLQQAAFPRDTNPVRTDVSRLADGNILPSTISISSSDPLRLGHSEISRSRRSSNGVKGENKDYSSNPERREEDASRDESGAETNGRDPHSPVAAFARQQAILEVLKRRPKISVGELDPLFSQRVSKKTLQRDLQDLIDQGVVKREGDKRWAVYSII